MPNDLAIGPLTSTRSGTDIVGAAKATSNPPAPAPDAAANPSPIPNPTLRLDPALGLVVLEFRSASGTVTTSIPSQRQLQAYQRWDATHFGPKPAGATPPQAAVPAPAHPAAASDARSAVPQQDRGSGLPAVTGS
jgi:hypothetical protein